MDLMANSNSSHFKVKSFPLVHPSSIEVFEHHEGIKALKDTIDTVLEHDSKDSGTAASTTFSPTVLVHVRDPQRGRHPAETQQTSAPAPPTPLDSNTDELIRPSQGPWKSGP